MHQDQDIKDTPCQVDPVLISLTKTKTKRFVNENTLRSLTKMKIQTKILDKR